MRGALWTLIMTAAWLGLTYADPPAPKPKEKFLGAFHCQGCFGVMDSAEITLDGKPTPYQEIPDETTKLVTLGLDLERRVVTRMAYQTRKDH